MKFLITGKPGGAALPPEIAERVVQATKKCVGKWLEDGTFECHYAFPEGGGIAIASAASNEELMDIMARYPLFPFMAWDIRPLADVNRAYDNMLALYQRAARANS